MNPDWPEMDDKNDPSLPGGWKTNDTGTRSSAYSSQASQSRRPRSVYRSRSRHQQRNKLSRDELRDVAESTLQALDSGIYRPRRSRTTYDISQKIIYTDDNTEYISPYDPNVVNWAAAPLDQLPDNRRTTIVIKKYSTLTGARVLHRMLALHTEVERRTIGVLNFASAKKPGGGFVNGAQAQEESLARSSTLYASLMTDVAAQFYAHYVEQPDNPYYTHAMVYSPSICLIRNDKGEWKKPIEVDILSSAAVNAGEIRQKLHWEEDMRILRARVRAAEAARQREKEREAERRRQREEERKRSIAESRAKAAEARRNIEEKAKAAKAKQLEAEKAKQEDDAGASEADKMDVDEASLKEGLEERIAQPSAELLDTQSSQPLTEQPNTRSVQSQTEPPDVEMAQPMKEEEVKKVEVAHNVQQNEAEVNPSSTSLSVPSQKRASTSAPNPADIPLPTTPAPEPTPIAELLAYAEVDVKREMRERIGRLLYLFYRRGASHLVLGSFGTGVFQNSVEMVAEIFLEFIGKSNGKFYNVFESVIFAIVDEPTVRDFRKVFGNVAKDADGELSGEVDSEIDESQDGKGDNSPERGTLDGASRKTDEVVDEQTAKPGVDDNATTQIDRPDETAPPVPAGEHEEEQSQREDGEDQSEATVVDKPQTAEPQPSTEPIDVQSTSGLEVDQGDKKPLPPATPI